MSYSLWYVSLVGVIIALAMAIYTLYRTYHIG